MTFMPRSRNPDARREGGDRRANLPRTVGLWSLPIQEEAATRVNETETSTG